MEFIKKLWNGDCSLVLTYWVFFVLFNGILTVLDRVAESSGYYNNLIINGQLLLIYFYIFIAFCYFIFSSVCVWRSSDKYNGIKFWKTAAKVMVVIGVIKTLSTLSEIL